MNPTCDIERVNETFRLARNQFKTMIYQLQSDAMAQMEHDQVETLIKKQGTEVMRLLLQGHLDERCKGEQRNESVRGADGVVRTRCRENCVRNLMTEFGQVVVRRKGYSAKGVESLFPLDAGLNLPEDKYSIASGVIEGACRHLIKDRLDRTGARWRMKSAEAIIRIRSLRSSGDFDAYWKFHREEERQRNHSCRYAGECSPTALLQTEAPEP